MTYYGNGAGQKQFISPEDPIILGMYTEFVSMENVLGKLRDQSVCSHESMSPMNPRCYESQVLLSKHFNLLPH